MSPEEMGWCRLDLIGCGYGWLGRPLENGDW
jgi:hypothetical protein